jgi:ferredoxin--NADP+ reductase
MKLGEYEKDERFDATVVSSTRITAEESEVDIREIVLDVHGPGIQFKPGQSIGVLVPGPHELGHEIYFRLYSVADSRPGAPGGASRIAITVKRVSYIDDFSGERFAGIASNYLCDRRPGDQLTVTGPYGYAFEVPQDHDANLILIGSGTGIAPFRAFIQHIYRDVGEWRGKVRLFYGAHTGLELVYMNELRDDFAEYYDEATFEAFKAVSPRPHWADPIAWDYCLEERSEEVVELLDDPKTFVYVAGPETVVSHLDDVFAAIIGSPERWARRKAELVAGGRWTELVY